MKAKLLFTHALTPLQPGTGQGLGTIDLPIAREVATQLPYLPGSSLKGVLRDQCADSKVISLFGPEPRTIDDSKAHAGEVQFNDQRLLLFPVRTLNGLFAWATAPFLLNRFIRETTNIGLTDCPSITTVTDGQAMIASGSKLTNRNQVILEDLDLTAVENEDVTTLAEWLGQRIFADDTIWQNMLKDRICVLSDDVFSFLVGTATEIIARNVLDENKAVENLWYEEALPAETVLYGLIGAQKIGKSGPNRTLDDILDDISGEMPPIAQLGGNSTIGRGLSRLVVVN